MMRTSHNVAAVSGACFVIRKDHAIPFDPGYREGLGMADWCLRLGQKGLRHVYTPFGRAVCENPPLLLTGRERSAEDTARFREIFGDQVDDPCYSGQFSRRKADYSLR